MIRNSESVISQKELPKYLKNIQRPMSLTNMEIDHNYQESYNLNESNGNRKLTEKNLKASLSFKLGDRIKIPDKNNEKNVRSGIIRYLGPVNFRDGIWAGIELDELLGKHDGQIDGVRYFSCPQNHGLFIKYSFLEHCNPHYHESRMFTQTPDFKIISSIGKKKSESPLSSHISRPRYLSGSTLYDNEGKSDNESIFDALSEELVQNQKEIYEGRILIDKLRLQISQKIKSKLKTDDEINSLNSLVAYLGDSIKNYEKTLRKYERRLQKVISDIKLPHVDRIESILVQENDQLKFEVSNLQKQIAELLSEKVKFIDKLESLEQSSQVTNNHLITLKSEIKMYNEEINYHKKQFNSQKQMIENKDTEISHLKSHLAKLRIEYVDMPLKELNDAKTELNVSNNDIKVLNQKLQEQNEFFSNEIKNFKALIEEKENIINDFKQSKASFELEYNKILATLDSSRANNLELKKVLEVKQRDYDELENSLFQIMNQKLTTEESYHSENNNGSVANHIREFISTTQQSYIESKSKLQEALDAHKRQTFYFEEQVQELNSRTKRLLNERNDLKADLDSMTIKFDDLNQENQTLRDNFDQVKLLFNDKEREIEYVKSQFNDLFELEERNSEYQKKIKELEFQIKELESQVTLRNNDIQFLQEEFNFKFNEILEDIKTKNIENENIVVELKRKCKQFQVKYESQLNQVARDKTEHVEEIRTVQEEFLIITEEKNKALEQLNLINQREKELNHIVDELQNEIVHLNEHWESKMKKIESKESDFDHSDQNLSKENIKDPKEDLTNHESSHFIQYISEMIKKITMFKRKTLSTELDVEGLKERYELVNEQLTNMCLNKTKLLKSLSK